MNILVLASAAREGGALTIYRQFLSHLVTEVGGDHWYLVIDSKMPCPAISGVVYWKVELRSWRRRIAFDFCGCAGLCRSHGVWPDVVVSLQNTGCRLRPAPAQIIYYHQSLPFYKQKWNLLDKQEVILFLYSKIYPRFVAATLNERTQVVVQIPFIKRGFVKRFDFPPDRVHVLFPDMEAIDEAMVPFYPFQPNAAHFLYPASFFKYKGHSTLIRAVKRIIAAERGILVGKIYIHLTLTREEAPEIAEEMERAGCESIFVFEGRKAHEELLSMYKSADGLLFPSTVETLGLPLIEAARFGIPIVAADLPYAHEVIGDYEGASFVAADDDEAWSQKINDLVCNRRRYTPLDKTEKSSWNDFFRLVRKVPQLRLEGGSR